MTAPRWIAAILLGLSSVASAQTEQALPDDESLIDEEQLQRDRYERLTVPVTIDGSGPYRFLIDTGAQSTVVTHDLVEKLSLRKSGTATLVAMGSSELVETVELDGLEFADRSISGLVSPMLQARHIGADGILGLDSLQDMRVLIDFRDGRMLVADAETLGGNSGYEIVVRARKKLGQMIITDATVNGIKTSVIIDTGAQNTIANPALVKRVRARDPTQMTSVDVLGTTVFSELAYLRSMRIGGIELANVPVGLTDSPVFKALGLEGKPTIVLGVGNLRVFDRVAIDFSNQRVLFDLPRGAQRGTARNWASRLES